MPAYKNDNTGTWFCKFYFTDWTGTKKQKMKKGFRTKKEALEFERNFLSSSTASCNMTFGNFVDIYMEDIKVRLKPTTYENKKFLIYTKLIPFFKSIAIDAITPATIRKWQNELMANPKEYSPTYLKTLNNQMSAILNYAVRYYQLPSNPCRIAGSMGKKNADLMQFWTVDEFNLFIGQLQENKLAKLVFEILFWTGIRSGELLALTSKSFDYQSNTLSITQNYARHKGEDLIMEPKTPKSKRIIALPDFLSQMIREYCQTLGDIGLDERLFKCNKHFLHSTMQKACKSCGVKAIRIHDLRHSHASFLIEHGYSPLLISERLGHENIQTTLGTYSHLYPNKQTEVAMLIDKLNNSSKNHA